MDQNTVDDFCQTASKSSSPDTEPFHKSPLELGCAGKKIAVLILSDRTVHIRFHGQRDDA